MLDRVGFCVGDYERSTAFYLNAPAPLGVRLLMEPTGRAAGFDEDARGFFGSGCARRRCEAACMARSLPMSVRRWMRATPRVWRRAGATAARPVCGRPITRVTTAP